jgi:hypothetical protein
MYAATSLLLPRIKRLHALLQQQMLQPRLRSFSTYQKMFQPSPISQLFPDIPKPSPSLQLPLALVV